MSDTEHMLEIQRTLGRLESKVNSLGESVNNVHGDVKGIDTRLRRVEGRSAVMGTLGGGIMAIGIDMLKHKMGI